MERILFLTVLHRLFDPGSDRSCVLVWKKGYEIQNSRHTPFIPLVFLG
jgi:hypothetical protein